MQVFKAFFKILNKNKLSMIIYIGIYMALTLMMSGNGAESSTTFSQVSMDIGIENKDKGELGSALVEYLSQNNNIKEIPKNKEELQDDMYYREIHYVLTIPEDFTEKFMTGEREEALEGIVVPGNGVAFLTEMEINEFLKTLGMYVDGGFEAAKAAEQTLLDMKKEAKVEFLSQKDIQERPAASYFFQYLPYIFLCMMLVSLSAVLVTFNQKDIDARNKCSAMSFTKRNFQMILGSIAIMALEYVFFMAVACLLYPDYMKSIQGCLSALNALAYMLVCLSIAFFTARVVKNDGELNMVANVVGLATGFLGGAFVPLEMMNEGVKKISKFVPSYWYVISNDTIWKLESFSEAGEIYINIIVTVAFAIAVFAVAMVVNRLKARTV